ncbi:MAG TPA: hypothetical protein VF507_07410 [Pyrinomonadaceae bacterium]|jgi:hypothetical protein
MSEVKFETSEHWERLARLRETDPRAFVLSTSEDARRTLDHYLRAKRAAQETDGRRAEETG